MTSMKCYAIDAGPNFEIAQKRNEMKNIKNK